MKKLLCIFTFTVALYGQASPNCNQINLQVTASGANTNYNNTGQQKCSVFQLKYFSEGFSALSLQVEFAPDVAGVPGAFSIIPAASLVFGANPSTDTTSGVIIVNGYWPWLRVNITSVTGAGFINYNFIGSAYIAPPTATVISSAVSSTTIAIGPDTPGTVPTKNPVLTAGSDGTNIRTFLTDTSGRKIVVGAAAVGVAPVGNPVLQGGTDGTNVQTVRTDTSGRQIAVGTAANGAAAVGSPVLIGGIDGAANTRTILTDTGGKPQISLGSATGADTVSNTNLGTFITATNGPAETVQFVFNGTAWDRPRTASLNDMPVSTTLTARNSIGAQLLEKGSRWTVISTPAVSTQATASIAAEASVRHIVDCVTFSAGSTTAPALTKLNINLRDGATGAGTIINSWTVVISALTGQNVAPQTYCGLGLVGTTNTAMTLEFSALLTNLFEDVTITGYNVN